MQHFHTSPWARDQKRPPPTPPLWWPSVCSVELRVSNAVIIYSLYPSFPGSPGEMERITMSSIHLQKKKN